MMQRPEFSKRATAGFISIGVGRQLTGLESGTMNGWNGAPTGQEMQGRFRPQICRYNILMLAQKLPLLECWAVGETAAVFKQSTSRARFL